MDQSQRVQSGREAEMCLLLLDTSDSAHSSACSSCVSAQWINSLMASSKARISPCTTTDQSVAGDWSPVITVCSYNL
jgi:hypothetical protein